MRFKLVEEVHTYIDKATGDRYIYDGTKYVKVGGFADPWEDSETARQEDEERKKQLEKDETEFGYKPDSPFTIDDEGRISDVDMKAKADKLDDFIRRPDTVGGIKKDSNRIAQRKRDLEAQRKASEAAAKKRFGITDGTQEDFKADLEKFCKELAKEKYERTSYWGENSRYSDGIQKRRSSYKVTENKNKPIVDVYLDRSSSFSDAAIKAENKMLAVLNDYAAKDLLAINLFYIADSISRTDIKGGNQMQGDDIIENLKNTKATNMIIMTDSDIGGTYKEQPYQLAGCVWRLFKAGINNPALIKSIYGKDNGKYDKNYILHI